MSHRINIVFDDAVWEQLQEVPKGERSRVVNQAVSESLVKYRRLKAIAALDELRKTISKVPGTSEQWVREDRDSHE